MRFVILGILAVALHLSSTAAPSEAQDIFDLFMSEEASPSKSTARSNQTVKIRDKTPAAAKTSWRSGKPQLGSVFDLFPSRNAALLQPERNLATRPAASPPAAAPSRPANTSPVVPTPRKLTAVVVPKPVVSKTVQAEPVPRPKPHRLTSVVLAPTPKAPTKSVPAIGCEQAKSIIANYAFTNVQAQLCEGSDYSFVAMRSGKQFVVKISASTGELSEVKRAGK